MEGRQDYSHLSAPHTEDNINGILGRSVSWKDPRQFLPTLACLQKPGESLARMAGGYCTRLPVQLGLWASQVKAYVVIQDVPSSSPPVTWDLYCRRNGTAKMDPSRGEEVV